MPYVFFYFPEIAETETRTITVHDPESTGLPAASYGLLEMFCDESGCDCRRVFFYVVSSLREEQDLEAVVAYGWEKRKFYAQWLHSNDPLMIRELQGPTLNLGSPQSKLAPAILKMIEDVALQDAAYVQRIKRHYQIFRNEVERRARAATSPRKPGEKKT